MSRSCEPSPTPAPAADAWRHFAGRYWAKEPVVVPGAPGSGLDAAGAHRLLVAAAGAPGPTRMRLAVADGVLRDPGPLLPSPTDRDAAGYAARLAGSRQLGDGGWLLTAEHALSLDFTLWSRVRDAVAGLWRHVGRPPLPVTTELAVGTRYQATEEFGAQPDAAALTWVLDGSLTMRVRPEHTGTEFALRATAGDLAHWPAGSTHLDDRTRPCTTLRLTVPARTTAALPYVGEVVGELLRLHPLPADAQPTIPHPAPADPDGRLTPTQRFTEPARRYVATLTGDGPERALLLRWAALRSAAGLHPAPPPRPGIALTPRSRLRRTTEILRMRAGAGTRVWAAHGHARTVTAPGAHRVLTHLGTVSRTTVSALAEACDLHPESPELLALLDELYQVRALDLDRNRESGSASDSDSGSDSKREPEL
ncbi:hypothetical protein ACIREE_34670 [Streptomyces sp. NPDC102467]|uniref:hypothetical protein n=1 Tax=Streptomyces sp. NPDC102467 TaxID=3366179 RepID=UPI0037FB1624